MSTLATPAPEPVTLDLSKSPRVPFPRLVKVEWRKMVDTRSGFWLFVATGGLLLLTLALNLLIVGLNDLATSYEDLVSYVWIIPVSILVPVFPILIVTNEWSQRTALTTFSLEPHRLRAVLAKLVAVAVLAVGTILLAVALAAVANILCSAMTGDDVVWNLGAGRAFWLLANQLLYFAMAFAIGTLLLNTPGAIAIFYVVALVLPLMVWSTLYALFQWARDLLPWIDLGTAMAPFTSDFDAVGDPLSVEAIDYAHVAVTVLVWVVVPLALGLRRITRAELK